MNQARRPLAVRGVLLPLVLAACWGCGEGKPSVESSTTEARVSGTVKVKGKLAKKGTVSFNPANYRRKDARMRQAPIRADGTYEITTLIGENTVSIGGTGLPGDTGYDLIPFDVATGTNTFDIVIPPPDTR